MVWWGTYGLNGWGSYDSKLLYAGYRLGGEGAHSHLYTTTEAHSHLSCH